MPIHDLSRDVAKQIRKLQRLNTDTRLTTETTGCHHVQVRSELDGSHSWLAFSKADVGQLTRDQDLEAVVQAKLIDHRIIEP